ncbi:MAG: DUF4474 domain-containing protein [Lachnospiraceae bacterium]|nr:DUF4474 domain-containing protein [Lachnospiraceae bacterium]
MYLFFAILLPILCILLLADYRRRKKIIQKVRSMCIQDKCLLLNGLLEPFGYYYIPSQDIFSSHHNAWQRNLGYCTFYDKAAPRLNMIFDCRPIYFNYQGKTWLLEFWKGQYGINTGGEIGLYYADRILEENELKTTLFQAVTDNDMLPLSLNLTKKGTTIASFNDRHWWLTTFRLGCFSHPEELALHVSVTFPNPEMAGAFVVGLFNAGYSTKDIRRYYNTISFSFLRSATPKGFFRKLRITMAQWSNLFWCNVYLRITKPFTLSVDRVLYLYYYLPLAFRRTLRIRKTKLYITLP